MGPGVGLYIGTEVSTNNRHAHLRPFVAHPPDVHPPLLFQPEELFTDVPVLAIVAALESGFVVAAIAAT